ncbi:MAG: PHP domain-containing protein [Bacillota bacterium]
MGFDLHTHTAASDGTVSAGELVLLAKSVGLKGIAITDHDTVAGIAEALQAGAKLGITVIPGIEISSTYQDEEIHILGYFPDWKDKTFLGRLLELKTEREKRAKKIISRLVKLGYRLNFGEVQKIAGKGVVGRPHIASSLVEKGYVNSLEEAFDEFLEKGSKAYFPRKKLPLAEALALLKDAKAVPVLAHPGIISSNIKLEPIIAEGIEGIEVYHPIHSARQVEKFIKLCRDKGLISTGGTDFHGKRRDVDLGKVSVNSSVVKLLIKKREELYV